MRSVSEVYTDQGYLVLYFTDGQLLCSPLAWFTKLKGLSAEEISDCEISPFGIHWRSIDLDLSIDGLMNGRACRMNETQFEQRSDDRYDDTIEKMVAAS